MRREERVREKLKVYDEATKEIMKVDRRAAAYHQGVTNALKWVLGELKDV